MIAIVFLFACVFWGPLVASLATLFTWGYRRRESYRATHHPEPGGLGAVFCFWYFGAILFLVGATIILGAGNAAP